MKSRLTFFVVLALSPLALMAQEQPTPTVCVAPGKTVTISITHVVGTAPYEFLWLKNGVPIAGATSEVLVLVNVTAADAGDYTCQITNSAGSMTTSVRRVEISSPARPGRRR